MKGVNVSEVTGALIQDATRALFTHQLGPSGGRGVGPFEEAEAESQFLRDLNRHVTYSEGLRYGTTVWCHTKWRYILRDANGERPGWSDQEDLYFFLCFTPMHRLELKVPRPASAACVSRPT